MYPDNLNIDPPQHGYERMLYENELYRIHCENPLVYPRQCIQTNPLEGNKSCRKVFLLKCYHEKNVFFFL